MLKLKHKEEDDMEKNIIQTYFLDKRTLISSGERDEYAFEVAYTLANRFGVQVVRGAELLKKEHIEIVGNALGKTVPPAFYHGFPATVRKLAEDGHGDLLLYDQLVHYARTYDLGDFSQPGRSLFEANFKRTAFNEEVKLTDFSVIR